MTYLRRLAVLLILPVVFLTGCPSQSTLAALTNILGTSAASIVALEGNTGLAAQLKSDTAAAVSAVSGWKTGTPAQNVIQALGIVEDDLNLIPATGPYVPLIDLAIGTVESIIALLPPPTGASPSFATAHAKRTITLHGPIPSTASQYKTQWNSLAPDSASKLK